MSHIKGRNKIMRKCNINAYAVIFIIFICAFSMLLSNNSSIFNNVKLIIYINNSTITYPFIIFYLSFIISYFLIIYFYFYNKFYYMDVMSIIFMFYLMICIICLVIDIIMIYHENNYNYGIYNLEISNKISLYCMLPHVFNIIIHFISYIILRFKT